MSWQFSGYALLVLGNWGWADTSAAGRAIPEPSFVASCSGWPTCNTGLKEWYGQMVSGIERMLFMFRILCAFETGCHRWNRHDWREIQQSATSSISDKEHEHWMWDELCPCSQCKNGHPGSQWLRSEHGRKTFVGWNKALPQTVFGTCSRRWGAIHSCEHTTGSSGWQCDCACPGSLVASFEWILVKLCSPSTIDTLTPEAYFHESVWCSYSRKVKGYLYFMFLLYHVYTVCHKVLSCLHPELFALSQSTRFWIVGSTLHLAIVHYVTLDSRLFHSHYCIVIYSIHYSILAIFLLFGTKKRYLAHSQENMRPTHWKTCFWGTLVGVFLGWQTNRKTTARF